MRRLKYIYGGIWLIVLVILCNSSIYKCISKQYCPDAFHLYLSFHRHVLFAPSSKNVYASDKFAGLVDAMFDIDNNPDVNKWETVKQQLAAVIFAIQSAASTLSEVA